MTMPATQLGLVIPDSLLRNNAMTIFSTGRFTTKAGSHQKIIGAPRGGPSRAGQVYIIDSVSPGDGNNGKTDFLQKLSGDQMGEFFGGSLASLDLNGDGLDDLVVGSPLATAELVRRKRSAGKYIKVKIRKYFLNLIITKIN